MKLQLLFINILLISSATMQIYSAPPPLGSQASDNIVRLVAFGASASVAVVGLGIGSFGTMAALGCARSHENNADLGHFLGSIISVPAMFVGSLATYSALLSVGIRNKPAVRVSAAIFGVSMLLNSLSHWINLKKVAHTERKFCIGMGVFTGIAGLAALGLCLKK